MTNTITGVLLDAYEKRAGRADIPDELSAYYRALDCSCVDIVSRRIGGKRFDIVCDDEGLLKEDCRISAFDLDWQPMLCGSLFVCKSREGELVGLTEAEIAHVLRHVRKIPTRRYPVGVLALTMVEY